MYQTSGNIDIYKLAQRFELQYLDSQPKKLEHFWKGHDHNYRTHCKRLLHRKRQAGK